MRKELKCAAGGGQQGISKLAAAVDAESPSYRAALRNLFSCRHGRRHEAPAVKKCKKPEPVPDQLPPEPCKRRASVSTCGASDRRDHAGARKFPFHEANGRGTTGARSVLSSSSSTNSSSGSFRLRRLSGCYECHIDPISGVVVRDSSSMRAAAATICSCADCGEIFTRAECLEQHQSIRHAVSELCPQDSSRNIIEIIFQSSWLKKQSPEYKIERILKVHNTEKTVARFEGYRDAIKIQASKLPKKHPRCVADGNELLMFHCATLACPLGLDGSTGLCSGGGGGGVNSTAAVPSCAVCRVVREGFRPDETGRVRMMATSGRAHDAVKSSDRRRAMLVCRVIAGTIKKGQDATATTVASAAGEDQHDSVAGAAGVYATLDELFVLNPKAILPCFVVIYRVGEARDS